MSEQSMEFHEAANIFPMEPETIDGLAEDIKENGQLESIKLYYDKIIDGRRRFTACKKIGVKPMMEQINTDDPIAYVVSLNLKRRQLTPSQKSIVAARVREIYDEQAKDRQKRKPVDSVPVNLPGQKDSRDAAGKAAGVSGKYVDFASKVLEHGEPELVKAVEEGRVAVSTAAMSAISDTPETQKELATNATRTYERKPKKQHKSPEEKQAEKNGVVYDAGMYAKMAIRQLDRIEQGDPTAIESLEKILKHVEQKIKNWR